MPDNTKNFAVDETNGPIGATTVDRAEFITALEQLNYAAGTIRSIDELTSAGLIAIDGSGDANARIMSASNGLTWTNANGEAGNPTVSLGTPSLFRQALNDTEADALTLAKKVSIISTSASYALPTPTSSIVFEKIVINNSAGNATITSTDWADTGITTSVVIPTLNMAIFYSDLSQKWFVQDSSNLTIS